MISDPASAPRPGAARSHPKPTGPTLRIWSAKIGRSDVAAEKDLGLRFTLHQSMKLAQKKIEQQARWNDLQRQAELKLQLLEQSLGHLRSQQQLGVTWPDFARELQGLLAQSGGAASLEAELGEL